MKKLSASTNSKTSKTLKFLVFSCYVIITLKKIDKIILNMVILNILERIEFLINEFFRRMSPIF